MDPSRHISAKQATAYFAAMKHSRDQEAPLNLFVTLNLSCTSCPPGEGSAVMQRLVRERFGRWLRYKSGKFMEAGEPDHPLEYTWVMEAPNSIQNVHWCVQIDARLRAEFEAKLPKWLKSVAGTINDPSRCIHIREVDAIMGAARYCMKGIHPRHASRRYVEPEDQGLVYGKRVGISRSLGLSARRAKREDPLEWMPAAA